MTAMVNGTQMYHDAIRRIQELEELNSVLAAEVDRMRNVNAESVTYLADVEVVCTHCQQPIKARINTQQWIRVEWIGPEGECLKCYQGSKREPERSQTNLARTGADLPASG